MLATLAPPPGHCPQSWSFAVVVPSSVLLDDLMVADDLDLITTNKMSLNTSPRHNLRRFPVVVPAAQLAVHWFAFSLALLDLVFLFRNVRL